MNNEVIKAIKENEKKHTIRNWWNKNGYKVLRVLLFPIWFYMIAKEKFESKMDDKEEWSEKRAKEIFDYYIPRRADWNEKEKAFDFFDNGMGWGMCFAKKHLKRKDRRFWNVHRGFNGGKLRNYLIEKFELEGFEKEIGDCASGWTTIYFKMIEK